MSSLRFFSRKCNTASIRIVASFLLTIGLVASALSQGVSSIAVSQGEAWGGTENPYCYVFLSSPAGSGGVDVAIVSSDPAACGVPATLHIPEGADNNFFYTETHPVSANVNVSIQATAGSSASTNLLVKANRPSSVAISQPEAWGGTETPYVDVYIDWAAQPGGFDVALTSSHPSVAPVPANFTIAEGSSYNWFYVYTNPVSVDTVVTITATLNGGTKSVQLLVKANQPSVMTISQPEAWGGTDNPYVDVYIGGAAKPGGYDVVLTSSHPSVAPVPANFTIAEGSSYNWFYVYTNTVNVDTLVTITATLNGGTKSVQLLVKSNRINAFNLSQPAAVGGDSPYLECYLDAGARPGGYDIALTNSDPVAVTIPATLEVTEGSAYAWSYITVNPVSRVHYVQLTASLNGGTMSRTLIVHPTYKTVSGRINFQGLISQDLGPNPVTFELRTPGTTNVVMTVDGNVYPDGTYTFASVLDGQFDLALKTGSWLRKVVPIDTTSGDQYYADFDLINADIDGDNAVTVFDYAILSDYFDMSEGDAGWLVVGSNGFRPIDADLDRDGAVTVFDYAILSDSFDLVGDE